MSKRTYLLYNVTSGLAFSSYLLKMESKSLIKAAIITDIMRPLAPAKHRVNTCYHGHVLAS